MSRSIRETTILHFKYLQVNKNKSLNGPKKNPFFLSYSSSTIIPNAHFVNMTNASSDFEVQSALVFKDFITESESACLVRDVLDRLKRVRYTIGHWDSIITKYRETELYLPYESNNSTISKSSLLVIERIRDHIQHQIDYSITWLPCHIIDYHCEGSLSAHVDNTKASGNIIAGLSLLSACVLRLRPVFVSKSDYIDLYLPPLSLYLLRGMSRFDYTHEIMPSGIIFPLFDGVEERNMCVIRERRLSMLFRDKK